MLTKLMLIAAIGLSSLGIAPASATFSEPRDPLINRPCTQQFDGGSTQLIAYRDGGIFCEDSR